MKIRIVLTTPFASGLFAIAVLLVTVVLPAQTAKPLPGGNGIPRMPDGRPDLSGVWDRPFVPDMTKSAHDQRGEPQLPLTDWAKQHLIEEFDYSGHCLPLGYTRGINSPMPVEIVQRPDRVVL